MKKRFELIVIPDTRALVQDVMEIKFNTLEEAEAGKRAALAILELVCSNENTIWIDIKEVNQ